MSACRRGSPRLASILDGFYGQPGSYKLVRRISTEKRACIDWSGQPPGGRQTGNYPETALWETSKPSGVFFGARLQVALGRVDRLRSHMSRPLAVAHELTALRSRMNQ